MDIHIIEERSAPDSLRVRVRKDLVCYNLVVLFLKEFKTLDEQIDILTNRGLVISDTERAKKYLLSQNYYNIINGYAKFFPRTGERYTKKTTFDEITSLYVFEREFKQTLLIGILEAETHLRAIFSYRFAEMYQNEPYAYLNIKCYEEEQTLPAIKTISSLAQTISNNLRQKNGSIAHYVRKYKHVPIWVLVNYLNLGELRYLLLHAKKPLQNSIARDFTDFISQNISGNLAPFPPETLNSFIDNINQVRNICAHNNRILEFRCHQNAKYWKPLHSKYNLTPDDDKRSTYSVFITLQCFLSKHEYATLHNTSRKRIRTLSNKLKTISINDVLSKLGFPNDWHLTVDKIDQCKLKAKQ